MWHRLSRHKTGAFLFLVPAFDHIRTASNSIKVALIGRERRDKEEVKSGFFAGLQPQPCLQGIANYMYAVSCLLCLQELLAPVFIGFQALLMGKNDLFLAFYWPVKAICAVQRLQRPFFACFYLSFWPLGQWIRAQAAPVLIASANRPESNPNCAFADPVGRVDDAQAVGVAVGYQDAAGKKGDVIDNDRKSKMCRC